MIRSAEFTKNYLGDKDVSKQLEDFCNKNMITKDKIVDIKYTSANDGTVRASAILVYEE